MGDHALSNGVSQYAPTQGRLQDASLLLDLSQAAQQSQNPYPNTGSPGQNPKECEAGNENYIPGKQVIGNVPGNQGTSTETTKRSLKQ